MKQKMIILTIKAKVPAKDNNELLSSLKSMRNDVNKVQGCLRCTCDIGTETEGICFTEQWKSRKELEEHMQSDLYRALLGAFKVLSAESKIKITESE